MAAVAVPALVGGLLWVAPPAGASTEPTYFIAIGDSLPLGEQAEGARELGELRGEPILEQGFVGHMAQRLSTRFPDLVVRNLGCSGETSWGVRNNWASESELLEGRPAGCQPPSDYRSRYPSPGHSQLTEAVEMLRTLGGAVKLVTVTAGANDVHNWCELHSFGACQRGQTKVLEQVREEMSAILDALDEARRPSTRIVGTLYYNPYQDRTGQEQHAAMVEALNDVLLEVYTEAHVLIADAERAIPGESVCDRTTWCSQADAHPNDDGYRAIGEEFLRVLDWNLDTAS